MKVGLLDVDSHNFPNLAQMKLSAYHKARGDDTERWCGVKRYDIVYKSRVFDDTYSNDELHAIMADQIIAGGTGYDLQNKLPDEIEHCYPDYDLYGIKNAAYGFLTRGCPRACPFCIVSGKEGRKSKQVAELSEFWRGQREIVLLDPNITASVECEKLFEKLIESGARVNFTQGLDIRRMTDEKIYLLNKIRTRTIYFAWDNYEMVTYELLKRFRPSIKKRSDRLWVYVLTNFNTSHDEDLERIYKLREAGYDPYVMVFDKPNAPRKTRLIQRWCNNKLIFRSCEKFEDYNPKMG